MANGQQTIISYEMCYTFNFCFVVVGRFSTFLSLRKCLAYILSMNSYESFCKIFFSFLFLRFQLMVTGMMLNLFTAFVQFHCCYHFDIDSERRRMEICRNKIEIMKEDMVASVHLVLLKCYSIHRLLDNDTYTFRLGDDTSFSKFFSFCDIIGRVFQCLLIMTLLGIEATIEKYPENRIMCLDGSKFSGS